MEFAAFVKAGWRALLIQKSPLAHKRLAGAEGEGVALECLPSARMVRGVGGGILSELQGPKAMQLRMTHRACGWWPRAGGTREQCMKRATRQE